MISSLCLRKPFFLTFLCLLFTLQGVSQSEVEKSKSKVIKLETTSSSLIRLKKRASLCQTAESALKLYNDFLATHEIPEKLRQKFDDEHKKWKDYSKDKLVRNGRNWVTEEENKQLSAEANLLIDQAIELVKLKHYKEAVSLLLEASETDGNGLRADFILGTMYSPLLNPRLDKANKHFQQVVLRSPENISALNNLALIHVRRKNFPQAYKLWDQALAQVPQAPEITHNLGYLISESAKRKLRPPSGTLKKISKLYATSITRGKGERAVEGVGWIYLPLVLPSAEKQKTTDKKDTQEETVDPKSSDVQADQKLIAYSSGSGFVFHKNKILTNKHVVYDEEYGLPQKITVQTEGGESTKEYTAKVIAKHNEMDLAILEIEQDFSATPLSIISTPPRRASELAVLGFPNPSKLGNSLKVTKGSYVGRTAEGLNGLYLYDAVTNQGNSGGPVCNKQGEIIAVHAQGIGALALRNLNGGKYGGGVPITDAIPFLQRHVPNFTAITPSSDPPKDWPTVVENVAKSTVTIFIYRSGFAVNVKIAPEKQKSKKSKKEQLREAYLIDDQCNSCHGKHTMTCTNRKCIKGRIRVTEWYDVPVGRGRQKTTIRRSRRVSKPCSVCRGSGTLPCNQCR